MHILLALVIAQTGLSRWEPWRGRNDFAFLEFAPSSGAGIGSACLCTSPTGAKGETLTFARASSGTCLKSGTVTSIANGDMVTCTNNQPRVMPGGDGSGGNGLLVEGARTNDIIRSQEFENAAWSTSGTAITVTADQAVAPDGTTTADRLQVPGVVADTGESVRYQAVAPTTRSGSFFVKGNGTSGTVDMYLVSGACASCSFNASTWTRCVYDGAASSNIIAIGLESITAVGCPSGHGAKSAIDIFVWGAQSEVASFASSYIATTSAAVARTGETADFEITWAAGSTTGISMASTIVAPAGYSGGSTVVGVGTDDSVPGTAAGFTSPWWWPYINGGAVSIDASGSSSASLASGGNWDVSTTMRWATYHSGALITACKNGSCAAGNAATWLAPRFRRFNIGGTGSATQVFGVVKRACLDPSFTRCR
jgi:hypothetical protein